MARFRARCGDVGVRTERDWGALRCRIGCLRATSGVVWYCRGGGMANLT